MFGKIPERQMHRVRWFLTVSWLLLIFSLFFDPISPWFAQPHNHWSPLRLDANACTPMQGACLLEKPYAIGAPFFWGIVIPCAIFILLVFGHELWRRICPLSFLSQIPRALGIGRKVKQVEAKTGKIRYIPAKVNPNSWLARNHLYLQLGLFYGGLCGRILFFNSARWVLGVFLLFTIGAAIVVGYLWAGKPWCNYFCPMSAVQRIYSEPRGLLTSPAHLNTHRGIPQSMCRTVDGKGKEKSACVACQDPCIDRDAERSYWENINRRDRAFLYYSYCGLVVGYFCYYYLYSGNWNYYFSGAWAHEETQLTSLFNPGFYIFGQGIPIPKLLAVPLTLGLSGLGGYFTGCRVENGYKAYLLRTQQPFKPEIVRHRMFTLCTFFVFNFFFIFSSRNFIALLPLWLQYGFNATIFVASTLWVYRTWGRDRARYLRESLAVRLRKQLNRLNIDISQGLEGRSLETLNPDELYVLAKILPELLENRQKPDKTAKLQDKLHQNLKAARPAQSQSSPPAVTLETVESLLDRVERATSPPISMSEIEWSVSRE